MRYIKGRAARRGTHRCLARSARSLRLGTLGWRAHIDGAAIAC
ncbi:hypothetical protein [Corynebacterium tuberculostearicum]|nr:hypothetical protein [Corynebacterium tuberculostearicum]MDV2433981.1 hypothetical protein [Corynebacterium tuberculostearicum]